MQLRFLKVETNDFKVHNFVLRCSLLRSSLQDKQRERPWIDKRPSRKIVKTVTHSYRSNPHLIQIPINGSPRPNAIRMCLPGLFFTLQVGLFKGEISTSIIYMHIG